MHTFKVNVELKSGYVPVVEITSINEMSFFIQASCRVNAKRMVAAMLDDNKNVSDYDIICVDGCCDLFKEN